MTSDNPTKNQAWLLEAFHEHDREWSIIDAYRTRRAARDGLVNLRVALAIDPQGFSRARVRGNRD